MRTTDQLINTLHEDMKPVKKLWPVGLQFVIWAGISFALTWLGFRMLGMEVHPEIVTDSTAITFEVIALATLLVLSVLSALVLSRPDRGKSARWLPLITVGLWLTGLVWATITGPEFGSFGSLMEHIKSYCFRRVVLLSIVPAAVLFILVRLGAPTKISWASVWSGMTGAAVGYFAVRVDCWYLEPFHVIFAHGLPIVLILAVSFLLGRKLLRW